MNRKIILKGLLSATTLMSFSALAQQNEAETDTLSVKIQEIEVVRKNNRLFTDVPGSVIVNTENDIKKAAPLNISDVLRKNSGINVVDEDGAGLRTNIGIRGFNPIRSSKVLVLEDGVPVTLNPYGEPTLYFSPMIDLMSSVEVLKGSGQIEFGPQTIGGIVNLITEAPPLYMKNKIKLSAGRDGFFVGSATHGNTVDNVGYIANVTHKRADNLAGLDFGLTNVMGKVNFRTSEKSDISLKLTALDEKSNSTYLGITQAMYDNNDNLHTTLAPDDLMLIRRLSFSAIHNYQFNQNVRLQTTAYAYGIKRNWRRQQFTRDGANANSSGVVWGDPNLTDGSSIFMSNKADWRNRQYQVGGIETKLLINHNTFGLENRAKIGARYLRERVEEQFIQTSKPTGWGGNMRDNEVRDGNAISMFAINNTKITDKLSAEYGIRLENYDYQRRIYRGRFNVNGNNITADTLVSYKRNSFALLPGLGVNYTFSDKAMAFAGVHKGYAPPQVKSAITATGIASNIDKEESVNYELGTRFNPSEYLNLSATLFYMDFDNQVIPVNTAINPSGVASGGKTKHKGIEVEVDFDIAKTLGSEQSVSIGGNFTYSQAKFAGDEVIENFLPYSPEYIINSYIAADFTNGFGIAVFGNYVSEQFNDSKNTFTPTPNGLVGRIDSRFILDATAYYSFKNTGLRVSLSAKNLLDEKYIVSRNPQGIRVGLDRFITAGVEFTF